METKLQFYFDKKQLDFGQHTAFVFGRK